MAQGISRPPAAIPHRQALWIFLFFLAFYYLTNAGWYKIGDEIIMRAVAKQIAQTGKIGIEARHLPNLGSYKEDAVRGLNGLYYFKWGLGQSLVEAPFYYIFRLVSGIPVPPSTAVFRFDSRIFSELMVIFLCPSAVSALGCALFFLLGLRIGFSNRLSLLLTLIYGLATMVWPYSKSLMSEATQNVAVLSAVYGAVSYATTRSRRWLALSGASIGFAVITKVILVVTAPFLIAYVLVSCRSRGALRDLFVYFLPPFFLFLGIQFWYNWIRYHSLFKFGYDQGFDALGFTTPLHVGLWGLFLSPGKSFFLYAPVAILGLVSAAAFYKKRKWESLLFLLIVLGITLPHALWCSWPGDWAWGPRFLLTITPYLILPAGMFFRTWVQKSCLKRKAVVSLIVLSLGIQLLGVFIHPYSYIKSRTEVVDKFVEIHHFSYLALYSENAFVNFSPVFSHIIGNWWLFKHMIFSYDLWSDAPWQVLGNFKPDLPTWVKGNRTIPFWWPITLPLISSGVRLWVYPLGIANFLLVVWFALKLKRTVKAGYEEAFSDT
ncbi:MAG: glycosyltransferase family 39 protein [Deltaproteobacteria bacterium]|nr:glycosyltransferase family 39 protein [Deltaproteobacteria bacterium]MBW2022352.1 glycosyltransferase family 39 protein [Deltaproteobacteria bacterium]MBW2082674.1 glycosyltransferase family 39 protein [Deltaproteobacteria bacterium]